MMEAKQSWAMRVSDEGKKHLWDDESLADTNVHGFVHNQGEEDLLKVTMLYLHSSTGYGMCHHDSWTRRSETCWMQNLLLLSEVHDHAYGNVAECAGEELVVVQGEGEE